MTKYLIVSKYDLWLYATIVLGVVFKKMVPYLKKQKTKFKYTP